MEQTDIFSPRIRWVAIATGVASALALFPILFLVQPALMITGGLIQPRFPIMGKWFVWASAANLWAVVIVYDVMMFPHPFRRPGFPAYMVVTFSATTVLLTWCSVELVVDALRAMRAYRAMPPAEPRPMSRGVWILAAVLNLLLGLELALGWGAAEWVLASSWYRYFVLFYNLAMPGTQAIIIVAAFDIYLMRRVVMLRRARRAGQA